MNAIVVLTVEELTQIVREHVQRLTQVQKVKEINFYVNQSTLHKCEIKIELEAPKL